MSEFLKPKAGSNKPTDMGQAKGSQGESLPGVVRGTSKLDKEGGVSAKNEGQYKGAKTSSDAASLAKQASDA